MILDSYKLTAEQVERLEKKIEFYNNDEGEKEIFNLMVDARLFEECRPEDLPLRNYAIKKLTELGLNMEFKIRKAIHDMLQQGIPKERIKQGDIYGND